MLRRTVAAHRLGFGVEPLGVGSGLQLVLVHGERGRRGVGVGERVGGQPGVEGRAELGAEPVVVERRRAPASSVAVALTHWKNMAMSTWVWRLGQALGAGGLDAQGVDPARRPWSVSPFHRFAW